MTQAYEQLHAETLPSLPPTYEDLEVNGSNSAETGPPIEHFEIDNDETYEPLKTEGLWQRFRFVTLKLVFGFHDRIVDRFAPYLDPLYEGYSYFSSRFEQSILKVGNPLVVKRLLYVVFVVIFVYIVTLSQDTDGVNGASGGAFSMGKFYDVDKLADTLKHYIEGKTLQENFEYIASMPHLAGSKGDLALAKYVESYFSNNGVSEVDFVELESFLNYPGTTDTYLKLSDDSFSATLTEKNTEMHNLAFNQNSPSSKGEINAAYVFGNYGGPDDLQKLADSKIELKDSILLVRYGGDTPEANKVYAAHRLGVKAVIFISPVMEVAGKKRDDVIQRVNVGLTRFSPGDVLTPGWPSHDGYVSRLDWEKSMSTAKIPTIPISWKDGKKFVEKLGNTGVDFGSGMFSGTKSQMVKFSVKHVERPIHQIWNVMGTIPGREQADKGIIFGAARDAACYGASSSASGTAVLLELVKIFTALQRRYNWTPARTIYFISLDGSAYNLAGATEWVEDKKKELSAAGYAYFDLNSIATGDKLSIKSHPLMHDIIKDALKKVELNDDQKSDSIHSLYDLYKFQNDGRDDISNNMLENKNYLPFINEVNVPAMEISFKGRDIPENSCFDSFENYQKAKFDSNMNKHIQILEVLARVGLSLAEEPLIPFNFEFFAEKLTAYKNDLEKYVQHKIELIHSNNVAQMNYEGIRRGIETLKLQAHTMQTWTEEWKLFIQKASSLEPTMVASSRRQWNDNMVSFNKDFLMKDSRPPRAGYLNLLLGCPFYAPSHDDDTYEWNSFPMVRDYAAEGDFGRAQYEIDRVANMLVSASEALVPH